MARIVKLNPAERRAKLLGHSLAVAQVASEVILDGVFFEENLLKKDEQIAALTSELEALKKEKTESFSAEDAIKMKEEARAFVVSEVCREREEGQKAVDEAKRAEAEAKAESTIWEGKYKASEALCLVLSQQAEETRAKVQADLALKDENLRIASQEAQTAHVLLAEKTEALTQALDQLNKLREEVKSASDALVRVEESARVLQEEVTVAEEVAANLAVDRVSLKNQHAVELVLEYNKGATDACRENAKEAILARRNDYATGWIDSLLAVGIDKSHPALQGPPEDRLPVRQTPVRSYPFSAPGSSQVPPKTK